MDPKDLQRAGLPAYRLGMNPVDFERFARLAWSDQTDDALSFRDRQEQYVHQIKLDLAEIDEILSDHTLRDIGKDFYAAARYAWQGFREAWDSGGHRDAIEYLKSDWRYFEEAHFDWDEVYRKAPFGRGAWADLHRQADRYRRALPEPLSLCASLGANVSAVRWGSGTLDVRWLPPGLTPMPAVRVSELLVQVAEHFPSLSTPSREFAADIERSTHGHATTLDPDWAVERVKALHGQIVRCLKPSQGNGRIFVGTKKELNLALGVSKNYTNYFKYLSERGMIRSKKLLSKLFQIEILDDEILKEHGEKLAKYKAE
jgi:hypothetical protein